MEPRPSTSTPRSKRTRGIRVSYREESGSDEENQPGPSRDWARYSLRASKDTSRFTQLDSSDEDDSSTLQSDASSSPREGKSPCEESYYPKTRKKCYAKKNYCFVCGKDVYKIARHLQNHVDEEPEIAEALAFPLGSAERKKMLDELRNRGNYQHNRKVFRKNSGVLKLKRRTQTSAKDVKNYFTCPYCKGTWLLTEMRRHVAKCVKKTSEAAASGEITLEKSKFMKKIPPAVKEVFSAMGVDEVSVVVQNDYLLIQLAKTFLEKYGNNPSRGDHVRHKLKAMGRLLLEMHKKFVLSFKDALQPENFSNVVDVVKSVAEFDDAAQSYSKPDDAFKVVSSLKNIACMVLNGDEDEDELKSNARRFLQLCEKEWDGLAPGTADASLSGQISSPATIPFTRDVQAFCRYLERLSACASQSLQSSDSPQAYNTLCRVTLAQASVLSKYAPEVSEMTLKSFQKRGESTQVLSKHFISIRSRTGRSVAVLLTSQLVRALTLLVGKREACGVHKGNHFLFAKPDGSVTSHFHGETCIKSFSNLSHARNPENLRSPHLHKHVARIFQILSLENDELMHLARLLGHDIWSDRDYYRSPLAAVELAKIAKLLLAMEKGSLEAVKGNSLEEVEIEEQLESDVEQEHSGNTRAEEDDEGSRLSSQQSDPIEQHGRQLTPFEDALEHMKTGKDKPFLQKKFIDLFKGRGLFTRETIEASSFVVEYRGETIPGEETQQSSTDALNGFLFDFWMSGTNWCVDASKEIGSLGRLVNDDHVNPSCEVKKMFYEGKPHLCLFARRKISAGEEITFDYGGSSYPWRSEEPKEVNMSEADVGDAASSSVNDRVEDSTCAESSGEEYVCDEEPSSDDSFSESVLRSEVLSILPEGETDSDSAALANGHSCTKNNHCYVCGKPQVKISRHLFTHREDEPDIARVFALPRLSNERVRLLAELRNRGNHKHNQKVLKTGKGKLKMSKMAENVSLKTHSFCIYCKVMCVRKHFWRHLQRCLSKPFHHPPGCKPEFLNLVAMGILDPKHVSPGLKKMLNNLDDDISSVVLKDPYLLQLAQYLYYIKEQNKDADFDRNLRRICKVLRILQEKSIMSFEDALKPQNVNDVISAVMKLTNVSMELKRCRRLVIFMANIKLSQSLTEDADIETIRETEAFLKLCVTKWPLKKAVHLKTQGQPAMAFVFVVQHLHEYIESTLASAVTSLSKYESPEVYFALLRAVVAYLSLLNRHTDVSQVTLQSFQERGETNPQEGASVDQTQPEQFLSESLVKVNVVGQKGKKVALAMTPDLLWATTLLVEKRKACGVADNHPLLFGKPGESCTNICKVAHSINFFGARCGTKGLEGFGSIIFRKHIMRIFQILLLSNDELAQLAQLLGRDIRTEREYYRTPEAAGDIVKILELLSAIEDGSLKRFEGKSLEEMDLPGELHPVVEEKVEEKIDESELSLADDSFASKCSRSAKKKGKKGNNSTKKSDDEQTELKKNKDERSEETASGSKDKDLHVYFSDDDGDDMNVDFSMDIGTDDDDDDEYEYDEDVRNEFANGSAESFHGDATKEVSGGHEKKGEEKMTTEKQEEEAGKDDDDDDEEAGQDEWMDADSDGPSPPPSPPPPAKENKSSPALKVMKEVKVAIPKLNMEDLKSLLHVSRQASLVAAQPTKAAKDLSKVASASTQRETKQKKVHMNCSSCKKSMMKGHTAYQMKGFADVFCSKSCLYERFPHIKAATRTCHHCLKEISQLLDLIMACVDRKGTMKNFCSTACLCSFKAKAPSSHTPKSVSSRNSSFAQTSSSCSTCNQTCSTTLELTLDEVFHSFCSNDCMETFCRDKVGVCEGCSSVCRRKPLMLKLEDGTRTICGPECLEDFKKEIETPQLCTQCHSSHSAPDMVTYKTLENTVQLFCTRHCVSSYKLMPDVEHNPEESSSNDPILVLSKSDAKCCSCSKDLPRGSSLYQLRSKKEFFCSASCVSERYPHINIDTKKCHNCFQPISRPQNIILAPVDDSETMKELCSHACLSSVKTKRKVAAANPLQDVCKTCGKSCLCKFTVTVDGEVQRFCSSSCTSNYQNAHNISWSACDVCGAICPNTRVVLNMDDGSKTICGDECLVKFKQNVEGHQLCPTCHTPHQMMDMIEDKTNESVEFFCSHRCMMVHKAQSPLLLVEVKSPSSEVKPSLTSLEYIKEEPVDEGYTQISLGALSPPDTKVEPKGDLAINSVFSLMEDTKPPELGLAPTDLPSSCSACKNVLMDGERVYQRKNHKDIFCSTSCLLTFYQIKSVKKTCHFCLQEITQSQAVHQATVDSEGNKKDFCSQTCLSSFNYKRIVSTKLPVSSVESQSQCSMCSRYCISKREIILKGVVNKLCGDPCFHRFCNMNNLSICENCSSRCNTPLTLKMEDGNKTLCGAACLAQFRQKMKKQQPCSMCHSSKLMSDMVESKNADDVLELFCTYSCVVAAKIQATSASGASLNCDNCCKTTVPACHLAMSDASIKNFCSLTCAMAFKETQKDVNADTTSSETQTQKDAAKPARFLQCAQCHRIIKNAPKLVHDKGHVHFVCSPACSREFKRANNVTSACERCKNQRIVDTVKRIGDRNCSFCSDECSRLFVRELEAESGKRWRTCAFCLCVSSSVVKDESTQEEFCSDKCSSGYKMIRSHVVKCDSCGRKRRLKTRLALLGDVKHFCNLGCLLRFCCKKVHMSVTGSSAPGPAGTAESSPVIANVISLSGSLARHSLNSESPLQLGPFTDIQTKVVGHASVQTAPKELKNKSMLCVPLVHNKGVSCAAQTVEAGVQTVKLREKVRVRTRVLPVPLPVPVYVPLPMHMYSQFTPKPLALPVPLPVPVLVPERPNKPNESAGSSFGTEMDERSDGEDGDDGEEEEDGEEDVKGTTEQALSIMKQIALFNLDGVHQHTSNNQGDFVFDASIGLMDPHKAPPPESDPSTRPAQETRQSPQTPSSLLPALPPSPAGVSVAERPMKAPEEKSKRGSTNSTSRKNARLSSFHGVDAWRRWVLWRESQTQLRPAGAVRLKANILGCSSAEVNNSLCLFINEVSHVQDETLSCDRLFYLCLSIQQFLLKNGRIENIFSDLTYSGFSSEFTRIMKQLQPSVSSSGRLTSCVEEEFLWECKQLGAYSPVTLLNTLMFFCCKYFGFTTVQQHRQLTFTRLMSCLKASRDGGTSVLRFYPPLSSSRNEGSDGVPAKKPKLNEHTVDFLEITENTQNPLRCPVRLYEFYVSKCSESMRRCSNFLYLCPDSSCNPSSPLWFSCTPLDDATMEAMIIRFLTVRELQEGSETKCDRPPPNPMKAKF